MSWKTVPQFWTCSCKTSVSIAAVVVVVVVVAAAVEYYYFILDGYPEQA